MPITEKMELWQFLLAVLEISIPVPAICRVHVKPCCGARHRNTQSHRKTETAVPGT